MYHSDGPIDNEGALQVWGQGIYEKFLYLPPNFAVNLKILFKEVFKNVIVAEIGSIT